MRAIDLSAATWRKSSHSNQDGGNCIEVSHDFLSVATWRKSTHSNSDGGACLEVSDDFLDTAAWRTSTYSNQDGGQCLEFADNLSSVVPVRDSKDPLRGALVFEAVAWVSFVGAVKGDEGLTG